MTTTIINALKALNHGYTATRKNQIADDIESGVIETLSIEMYNELGITCTIDGGSTVVNYVNATTGESVADIDLAEVFIDLEALAYASINNAEAGNDLGIAFGRIGGYICAFPCDKDGLIDLGAKEIARFGAIGLIMKYGRKAS